MCETELLPHKTTVQVQARSLNSVLLNHACQVEGYEIHMGVTTRRAMTSRTLFSDFTFKNLLQIPHPSHEFGWVSGEQT